MLESPSKQKRTSVVFSSSGADANNNPSTADRDARDIRSRRASVQSMRSEYSYYTAYTAGGATSVAPSEFGDREDLDYSMKYTTARHLQEAREKEMMFYVFPPITKQQGMEKKQSVKGFPTKEKEDERESELKNLKRESALLYQAIAATSRQPKEGLRLLNEMDELVEKVTQLRLQHSRISSDVMRRKRTLTQLLSDLTTIRNESQSLGMSQSAQYMEALEKKVQVILGLTRLTLEQSIDQEIILGDIPPAQPEEATRNSSPAHSLSPSRRNIESRASQASLLSRRSMQSMATTAAKSKGKGGKTAKKEPEVSDMGPAEGEEELQELIVRYSDVELMTKTAEIQKCTLKHILDRTKGKQASMDVKYRDMKNNVKGLEMQLDYTRTQSDQAQAQLDALKAKHEHLKQDVDIMRAKRQELMAEMAHREAVEKELMEYVSYRDEIRGKMVWDIRNAFEPPPLEDPGIVTHKALHSDSDHMRASRTASLTRTGTQSPNLRASLADNIRSSLTDGAADSSTSLNPGLDGSPTHGAAAGTDSPGTMSPNRRRSVAMEASQASRIGRSMHAGSFLQSGQRMKEWQQRIYEIPRAQKERIPAMLDHLMETMGIPMSSEDPLAALVLKVEDLFNRQERVQFVRDAAKRLEEVNEVRKQLELEVAQCHISGNPGEAKNRELERLTEAIKDVEGQTVDTKKQIERERAHLATIFNGLGLILRRLGALKIDEEDNDPDLTALRYAAVGETPPDEVMDLLIVRPDVQIKDPTEDMTSLEKARLALRQKTMSRNQAGMFQRSVSMGPRPEGRTSLGFERTSLGFDPEHSVAEDSAVNVGLPVAGEKTVERTTTLRFGVDEVNPQQAHSFKLRVAKGFDSNIRNRDPYELKMEYLNTKTELILKSVMTGGFLGSRLERKPTSNKLQKVLSLKGKSTNKLLAVNAIVKPSAAGGPRIITPQGLQQQDSVPPYDEAEDDIFIETLSSEALDSVGGFYRHMKDFLKQSAEAREAWELKKSQRQGKKVAAHERLAHSPRHGSSRGRNILAHANAAAAAAVQQHGHANATKQGSKPKKDARSVNFSSNIKSAQSNASAMSGAKGDASKDPISRMSSFALSRQKSLAATIAKKYSLSAGGLLGEASKLSNASSTGPIF